MSGVRYDSPTYSGFSASASYGEDDDWEVAARYTGETGGFKLAFGIGYSVNTDESTQPPAVSLGKDSEFFQAGGYVQHIASGLLVHAAYGAEDNNGKHTLVGIAEPNSHQWYVKGGIRQQWLPLGSSVIYAEYGAYVDQLSPSALAAGATSSEFERFGVGFVQEIDAASMSLWIKYREHHADIDGASLGDIDDFHYVSMGALINF
jgi:predicted porin